MALNDSLNNDSRQFGYDEIASELKVAFHRERLEAYLREELVFPVTLELDITTECTRTCPSCPMMRTSDRRHLDIDFIENLFASLEGRSGGLLLAGGEPTLAPGFSRILAGAVRWGFKDVAVVTNGSRLHLDHVAEALLAHASVVRVSMYEWGEDSCGGPGLSLKQIESLRSRIEKQGSSLQIGVSVLTWSERTEEVSRIGDSVRAAGADWVYFHPMCQGWEEGAPARVAQDGVLREIEEYQKGLSDGFRAYVSPLRYIETDLDFRSYHAAHFLLVVGSDKKNYLGAEVKYQPQHVLIDLSEGRKGHFLWEPERLERIRRENSRTYPAIKSRHRGVLYSHLIEKLMRGDTGLFDGSISLPGDSFRYPYVL